MVQIVDVEQVLHVCWGYLSVSDTPPVTMKNILFMYSKKKIDTYPIVFNLRLGYLINNETKYQEIHVPYVFRYIYSILKVFINDMKLLFNLYSVPESINKSLDTCTFQVA